MSRFSFRASLVAAAFAVTTAFGTMSAVQAGNLQDEVDKALAAGAMKAA